MDNNKVLLKPDKTFTPPLGFFSSSLFSPSLQTPLALLGVLVSLSPCAWHLFSEAETSKPSQSSCRPPSPAVLGERNVLSPFYLQTCWVSLLIWCVPSRSSLSDLSPYMGQVFYMCTQRLLVGWVEQLGSLFPFLGQAAGDATASALRTNHKTSALSPWGSSGASQPGSVVPLAT
jgi:hypothetical protein